MTKQLVAFNADFDIGLGTEPLWQCVVFFNEPGTATVENKERTFAASGETPEEALGFALADAEKHGFAVTGE